MSKGLEAFKYIFDTIPMPDVDKETKQKIYHTMDDIEQDLTRLEKLEKVLEILKERGGIHLYINRNNDNKLTLDFDDCISCVLEPREYDLLKEVLENDK